ncbi:MAG TPA: DUF952 domain-containing protein [Ferruginibacter sp.]|nr:DUF952 domain-containing protein [Ferruginibacter sp.]
MIYHVTSKTDWENALLLGRYEAASLQSEGFIHNSTAEQVAGVLDRYYRNEKDLLLLHIDEDKLTAPLRYELAPSVNEMFPHLFGPLNLDAVVKTEAI